MKTYFERENKVRVNFSQVSAIVISAVMLILFSASFALRTANAESFNFKKQLLGETSTLSLLIDSINKNTGEVVINGVDTRPSIYFTWNWGDGTTDDGWFPQQHTYTDLTKNYILKVTSHYSDQETDSADISVSFVSPNPISLPPELSVKVPDYKVTLTSRMTGYSIPDTLTYFDNSFFDLIPRSTVEYVLTIAALIQKDFVNSNVYSVNGKFNQVLLRDPSFQGMYSLWYTNPVSFGVGDYGFNGTIEWSSFFHEMGHNFTLNTPSGYYYGGKTDGNANAIFSESMAQIFQHATAYELINNATAYGLNDDIVSDIKQSAVSSMEMIRNSYNDYLASGNRFASWNDPNTPTDGTLNTFMTIAYKFCYYAENTGVGYKTSLKRMMKFLQGFNENLKQKYDPQNNTPEAASFRATYMVTALSYAFSKDLRAEFRDLNFPISDDIYTELISLTSVSISGNTTNMLENSFADYKATALFTDGTTQDVTASAVWTENSAYASFDTSIKGRLKTITVSSKQSVTLTAKYTYNGITKTASMSVTIVPRVLTSLTIIGGASSVKGGSYSDYKATAAFDDGTTQDVTKTAVWTENSAYASMDYAVKGRMKTAAVRTEQTVTLTARYTYKTTAKTASVPVTITVPPALISVSVSGNDRVNENSSADYKAVAVFADGTSQDITASAVWSENSAYASMDTSVKGRLKTATVSSDQTATLTAKYTYNGITQTSSMPVTIAPKILDSVTVTGVSSVMGGAAGDYRAAAVFADGTTQDVTASAVWSENSAYSYMDTAVKGRLKTVSVSSGQMVTLTVRYTYKSVAKTASVPVMITVPSPLKEVSVTGPPAVNESSFGNYTAAAVFENGSTSDITAFAAWSENSAYASMDTVVKGRLKTVAVTADQNITLTVRYTLNGITKTASIPVKIINIPVTTIPTITS